MLELKAGAFHETVTRMAETASWVAATSLHVKADKDSVFHVESVFHEDTRLQELDRRFLTVRLGEIREHLDTLGARITALAVQEAEKAIESSLATWGNAKTCFEDIKNTLKRELSLSTVLVLGPKEQDYYAPTKPHFGEEVAKKFPTMAVFEIDEAAKCFALSRSTAAVFHLMRVVEVGIRAVARCLQIPDPIKAGDRNWGNVLKEIKKDLDAHAGSAPTKRWSIPEDKEFFEEIYVSLDAVRVAWRNTTMHVENKYTTDEAEHIFIAVKGFMKKMASRLDENGDPKA